MCNKIFKVKNERYNSNADFGLEQCQELCKLLGAKLITDDRNHYGFFDATFGDRKLSITRHRTIDRFDVRIDGIWSSEVKIKELSQVQVNNLIAKFNKIIAEDKAQEEIRDKKGNIHEKLYSFGVSLNDRTIRCNDFEFSLEKDGTFHIISNFSMNYLYLHYDAPTDAKQAVDNILGDYQEKREECLKALAIVEKHKPLIIEYYSY